MKLHRTLALALSLFVSISASAQEKFTIAGGGGAKNGSVYSSMVGTMAGVCSTDAMTLEEQVTTGGPQNLELLKGNRVKAAIIPSDVLAAAKFDNASSVAQIKTILTLHNEAAHLIARGDVKTEGGLSLGKFTIGGDKVVYNNPEDFKKRPIGVVGGSAVTARIISDMLRYEWQVTTFGSTKEMIDALTAGKVDGVLISAGLQSDAVKGIKGNFKLIPLRGNSDTAKIYEPMKVEYANLNGGRAVDTLGARALLVTRTWRSDEMLAQLGALRACLVSNIPRIQDATDTHPAWQDVNVSDKGTWTWYDLPAPKVAAAAKKK
jgi:TRAP-type uncharacterized transport system substrate-binding protein